MVKMRCVVVLLFAFGCIQHGYSASEVLRFKVLLFGDSVGYLTVSKETRADGSAFYLLNSYSKAKILWIVHENTTHYEVVYKDGKLFSSKFKEIEKGELKRWNNVTWDGKQYNVDGYKGKHTLNETPTFSIVSLFFSNAQNVKKLFYEAEADFSDVEHPESNTLEFKSSDGNRNVYHYVNGRANSMEFHVSIASVKMVKIN